MGHIAVASVNGQGILDKIIGADTEKVGFFSQKIGQYHGRGDFHHDSDVNFALIGQTVFFKGLSGFIQCPYGFTNFKIGCDHGKQDAHPAKGGRP